MGYTTRHGLIVITGGPKHQNLVSSTVKYLIREKDADPLDIYTESKLGIFRFDINWKGTLFEAETEVRHSLNKDKLRYLRENGRKVIFCLPVDCKFTNAKFYSSWQRWADVIQEVWILDTDKNKLVTTFTVQKEAS